MERIEYRTKDKSGWGDGPWQNEPDKVQWQDETTGFPCLMVRPHGSWCGYVGVPPTHPVYGKSYDDVDVSVHGGLTFANRCMDGPEDHVVCHKVSEGESDDVWWLGFDTAHAGDLDPAHAFFMRTLPPLGIETPRHYGPRYDVYRDQAYVQAEVENLARQLKDMGS